MVENVVVALAGAIAAGVILLAVRLLSQQREKIGEERAARRLDAARQDYADLRSKLDALAQADRAADQRNSDTLMEMRRLIDQMAPTEDALAEIGKKLDVLPDRLDAGKAAAPATAAPSRSWGSGWKPFRPGIPLGEGAIFPMPSYLPQGVTVEGAQPGEDTSHETLEPFTIPDADFGKTAKPFSIEPEFKIQVPPPDPSPSSGVILHELPGQPGDHPGAAGVPPHATIDEAEKRRTVDLMFATTRKYDDGQERFTGERNPSLTFGEAFVRVPEAHFPGQLERPSTYTLLSFTVYREKGDPKKHFVIRDVTILPKERWIETVKAMPGEEALVFVHGFNTSFEDALYRNAQIVYDLRFKGVPMLFSWPSRGAVKDYVYDRDSATGAREAFIEALELLTGAANIKQIHILAHSMGNMIVLDALDRYQPGAVPLRLDELMMAAPDVDRDLYKEIAPGARKFAKGMTLYASATDKALAASKFLAGDIPRAGDVPDGGPIVLPQIDTIDATYLGDEIFGLNHSTFARSLSILNDVRLALGGMRPPDKRVLEIRSIPEGADPPQYWQYFAGRG